MITGFFICNLGKDKTSSQNALCHALKIRISPKSKPSIFLFYLESKPWDKNIEYSYCWGRTVPAPRWTVRPSNQSPNGWYCLTASQLTTSSATASCYGTSVGQGSQHFWSLCCHSCHLSMILLLHEDEIPDGKLLRKTRRLMMIQDRLRHGTAI